MGVDRGRDEGDGRWSSEIADQARTMRQRGIATSPGPPDTAHDTAHDTTCHGLRHSEEFGDDQSNGIPLGGSAALVPPTSTAETDPRVCYGMLSNVKCQQFRAAPKHLLEANALIRSDKYVALSYERGNDEYFIFLPPGPKIAHLNRKAAAALNQLEGDDFHLEFYLAETDACRKLKSTANVNELPCLFNTHVNLYGPRSDAESLGSVRSREGLFLQAPLWMEADQLYINPHLIEFEGISQDDDWIGGLSMFGNKSMNDSERNWDLVLNDLPQHRSHICSEESNNITVPLLGHQLDANSFMLQRESGSLDESLLYWKLGTSPDGAPVYRHIVTGKESNGTPQEPRGGVLADDMGLGKTLSTISVIVDSLDRASAYMGDEEADSSSSLARTRATLVVVPSLLILDDWMKEIYRRTRPGTLRVTKYHGHERVRHFSELLDVDVGLTTYGTIANERRKSGSRPVLYNLSWFRIVLDEAHTIRSHNTKQAQAIMSLQAKHHWCLTGTPIVNKVEDLFPLLRFCRVPLLEERPCFREAILKIGRRSFTQCCRVLRLTMSPLCLRRTKDILNLPRPTSAVCKIALSAVEKSFYKQILRHSRHMIDATIAGNRLSRNKHTILQAILQLRRVCNHGTLVPLQIFQSQNELDADEALTLRQEEDDALCANCSSEVSVVGQIADPSSGTIGTCDHMVCGSCLPVGEERGIRMTYTCPVCEQLVKPKHFAADPGPGDLQRGWSTKLNTLVDDLSESQHEDKSLVFSRWKRTIDIASQMCTATNIKHVCIDGSIPQADRAKNLEQFISDPDTSVLLMTLGTGALGLNLTAATRIHILEPQWNPAVEEQAIGRAVRFGQAKSTTVIRYIVKNSVEEQIQGYQKRKIQLADRSFADHSDDQTEAQTRLLTAMFLHEET